MTLPSRSPNTGARPDGNWSSGPSRWLYLGWIVLAILILVFIALHLAGGVGSHGPGRHAPPSDAGSHTAPPGYMNGHRLPADVHGHAPWVKSGN